MAGDSRVSIGCDVAGTIIARADEKVVEAVTAATQDTRSSIGRASFGTGTGDERVHAVEELVGDPIRWHMFISHASEDKDFVARPLAKELKERGLRVWYDETSLRPGARLSAEIMVAIEQSRYVIAIISPRFLQKEWPTAELEFAEECGKVIIPVLCSVIPDDVQRQRKKMADLVMLDSRKGLDHVMREILSLFQTRLAAKIRRLRWLWGLVAALLCVCGGMFVSFALRVDVLVHRETAAGLVEALFGVTWLQLIQSMSGFVAGAVAGGILWSRFWDWRGGDSKEPHGAEAILWGMVSTIPTFGAVAVASSLFRGQTELLRHAVQSLGVSAAALCFYDVPVGSERGLRACIGAWRIRSFLIREDLLVVLWSGLIGMAFATADVGFALCYGRVMPGRYLIQVAFIVVLTAVPVWLFVQMIPNAEQEEWRGIIAGVALRTAIALAAFVQ